MAESSASMNATTGTAPANRGVKQGLPATGLPAAEGAAAKLWAVARLGTASPEAFARQFGEKTKASGSTWDTRMAMLRGFKLLRFEGKMIGLSELGQQLLDASNPAGQSKARQTAFMNLKAYRELVEAFNGTKLPDATVIATKLQFEYGKTDDFARRAATAFTDSLKHALMLDDDNFVRKEGVATSAKETVNSVGTAGDVAESDPDDETQAAEIDRAFDEEAEGEIKQELNGHLSFVPNMSLSLTLDLSNFRTEDVIKILSTLGFGARG
ncbi:hypothetical protein [Amycolatopsis jejuensis]|uniref:hypothetical protein n=1 Tax=Amycolatopsis jejuensis TaxID=330084 RepID=UPI0012DFF1F1|nr:hypothetical protein [Amycolatopsis jejuensis]